MPVDPLAKQKAIAKIIDGQVVDASDRVAVSIKGTVNGFKTTMEAVNCSWPFGVAYSIETGSVDGTAMQQPKQLGLITVYPRMGRGLMGLVTKLLLFEASGQPVGDKKLERVFNFSYDRRDFAERFMAYSGVADRLFFLENTAKFSEIVIRGGVGIYLSQPNSFNSLDLDICRSTVKSLGDLAQVLAELF